MAEDREGRPAAAVGARVGLNVTARGETRVRVYGYGEHPEVPNPGHLLLIARTEGAEIALMLRGRDMSALARAVNEAAALYADNAEWLSAPVTRLVGEGAA